MDERAADGVERVTFYFDPACPWTWITSRWLVAAAGARGVPVDYAAFELADGMPLDDVPAEHRDAAATSRRFLRVVAAGRRAGEHEVVGRWYSAFGDARFVGGLAPTMELARRTLLSVGGEALEASFDDASLDIEVAKSRGEAIRWAGDDAGSPVTFWTLETGARGFFGPVMAPQAEADASDAIWAAMVHAARSPELFEIKSRRTQSPPVR